MAHDSRPDTDDRARPHALRIHDDSLRTGLDYLECYASLFRLWSEPDSPVPPWRRDEAAELPDLLPRPETSADPMDVLGALDTFERIHADHPLVALGRDPTFDELDMAILYHLFVDRLSHGDGAAGLRIPQLLAASGLTRTADQIVEFRRFLPSAPLMARGLVVRRGSADLRLISQNLMASDALLHVVLADADAVTAILGESLALSGIESGPSPARAGEGDRACEGSTLGGLVLPPAIQREFDRVVATVQNRKRALAAGLGSLLPAGKGVNVLLSGAPGCGKTQAARALAHRLGRPLHLLSCQDVLDKYIGETERRITSAFARATKAQAVLCWDEADALLASRTEVEFQFQRQMVSTFLVLLESFEGVAVFTTNLVDRIDPAFERRFTARIEVPRPGPSERLQIWRLLLPAAVPHADDVDVAALAAEDLTGAEIRNAVLAAVTEAVAREPAVLTAADLALGIQTATSGRWTHTDDAAVGFRPKGQATGPGATRSRGPTG